MLNIISLSALFSSLMQWIVWNFFSQQKNKKWPEYSTGWGGYVYSTETKPENVFIIGQWWRRFNTYVNNSVLQEKHFTITWHYHGFWAHGLICNYCTWINMAIINYNMIPSISTPCCDNKLLLTYYCLSSDRWLFNLFI